MNLNHPSVVTLAGLTDADFDDALRTHFGPSRHGAVQATVAACSAVKRPYVPAGGTQQGRVEDAQRATCSNPSACTMPLCVCRPAAAEASNELCLEDDGEPWEPLPPPTAAAMLGWVVVCILALAVIVVAW